MTEIFREVIFFKVLSQHLPGDTEEKYENPRSVGCGAAVLGLSGLIKLQIGRLHQRKQVENRSGSDILGWYHRTRLEWMKKITKNIIHKSQFSSSMSTSGTCRTRCSGNRSALSPVFLSKTLIRKPTACVGVPASLTNDAVSFKEWGRHVECLWRMYFLMNRWPAFSFVQVTNHSYLPAPNEPVLKLRHAFCARLPQSLQSTLLSNTNLSCFVTVKGATTSILRTWLRESLSGHQMFRGFSLSHSQIFGQYLHLSIYPLLHTPPWRSA